MYADRDQYVADPRFVPVPVERMLEPGYIKLRAQLIGARAGPRPRPATSPCPVDAIRPTSPPAPVTSTSSMPMATSSR